MGGADAVPRLPSTTTSLNVGTVGNLADLGVLLVNHDIIGARHILLNVTLRGTSGTIGARLNVTLGGTGGTGVFDLNVFSGNGFDLKMFSGTGFLISMCSLVLMSIQSRTSSI